MLNNFINKILYENDFIELKIIPTYFCENNCDYCYNRILHNIYPQDNNKLLDCLDLFKKINTKKQIIAEIIGGEPLSTQTFEITKSIIKKLNKKIIKMVQSGINNIQNINKIFPYIDGFSYSIDLSNSPKVQNIKNIIQISLLSKKFKVPIQIQSIINFTDKKLDLFKFINICEDFKFFSVGLCFPNFINYSKKELDKQAIIYSELIKKYYSPKHCIIGGGILDTINDYYNNVRHSSCCMCGECSFTIQPDGQFTPCLHNNINKFIPYNKFAQLKEKRNVILKKGYCSNCDLWDFCHGGCIGNAFFISNDINERDKHFCYVLKETLKKLK